MEKNNWYNFFMENLHEIFPKNVQLTQELMDLLCLEREAVYRRLRKDVIFHANEVIKIASAWNISLDEIVGINSHGISFQMQLLNFLTPSKRETYNLKKRINALDFLNTTHYSEFMEICNRIPRPLCAGFPNMFRFKIFDWEYLYYQNEILKPFSQIIIPKKIAQEFDHYKKNMLSVTDSHFILDPNIIEYFVQSIQYYHSISLISDEEKAILKIELLDFLDYFGEIAYHGHYPETGNKASLYISKIYIDTNYSYLYCENLKTCRIHAFGQYDIVSSELNMVNDFRTWMNLKKRSAIQITEANEKYRIEYISKQRYIINGL